MLSFRLPFFGSSNFWMFIFHKVVQRHVLGVVKSLMTVLSQIFQSVPVKELWKSVENWLSYQYELCVPFSGTPCMYSHVRLSDKTVDKWLMVIPVVTMSTAPGSKIMHGAPGGPPFVLAFYTAYVNVTQSYSLTLNRLQQYRVANCVFQWYVPV